MSAQPRVSTVELSDVPSGDEGPPRKKRRIDKRSRHWFLTWNNPPTNGKEVLESLGAAKYVFQLEKASTGTMHWQGVFSFKDPKPWSTMDGKLKPKGVWAPCVNLMAARNYCSKVHFTFGRYRSFCTNILFMY